MYKVYMKKTQSISSCLFPTDDDLLSPFPWPTYIYIYILHILYITAYIYTIYRLRKLGLELKEPILQ